jgi:hypothetical protein
MDGELLLFAAFLFKPEQKPFPGRILLDVAAGQNYGFALEVDRWTSFTQHFTHLTVARSASAGCFDLRSVRRTVTASLILRKFQESKTEIQLNAKPSCWVLSRLPLCCRLNRQSNRFLPHGSREGPSCRSHCSSSCLSLEGHGAPPP